MSSSASSSPLPNSVKRSTSPPPISQKVNAPPSGVPMPATPTRYTAPVHIDVGGVIFTSTLDTLTRFSNSRLAKMFTGHVPIILDSLKQHYFIDRDGHLFRHVLNFLRTSKVHLPDTFEELDMLAEEARYYDIEPMIKEIERLQKMRERKKLVTDGTGRWECVCVHINPDLGERVCLTASRALVEEVFPELVAPLTDSRTSGWSDFDSNHVIRFPVNGYCRLTSIQVLKRLLNNDFKILASTGGGVESQQFSEYLFGKRMPSIALKRHHPNGD
ncbi:DgyrCDS10016 [Dimorphilus gyrociliatus]|uniref:DgyrCDS10016 n=1 Tax=Dimorphilus gyrociliatus TaxID=2664684 RepID=A0A7I8W035_9ANNE|nr:DgyrCDS10016 [Dimorphilus gyrociliatus]